MFGRRRIRARARGLLGRLRRDQRGNALAIMAAAMIPLAGLAGSAVDMGRLYTVKSRLQQACDAGVLAGRKFMSDSNSATLDDTATTQAKAFFANNFKSGWFKVTAASFTPTKTSDNQVACAVPMAVMQMFGMAAKQVQVSCQARYDVADTDVVFVLDTTGSMACLPSDSDDDCGNYVGAQINAGAIQQYNRPADSALGDSSGSVNRSTPGYPGSIGFYVPEKPGSRIAALRTAVINFYKTVSSTADPSTHVRYGFVTYTSAVNAGRAITDMSPSYMIGGSGNADKTWTYQSRTPLDDYQKSHGGWTTKPGGSQAECDARYSVARNPALSTPRTYASNGEATETKAYLYQGRCWVMSFVYGPKWTYQPVDYNVSALLTSAQVSDPSRVDGGTAQWQGCIEERTTTAAPSFDPTALPPDLDPDLVPDVSSTTGATSWRPMWPEVVYGRNNGGDLDYYSTNSTTTSGDPNPDDVQSAISYFNYAYNGASNYLLRVGWSVCGKPIRRLSTMSLTDIVNYVNATDFRPIGGTYHDTGMIWGVRLLSRLGIFKDDNQAWPGRQPPNRVLVFLTDGDMAPSTSIYGMYGIEYFDRRVTGGNFDSQKDYHNARFLAECAKAKAMNVSVWTVSIAPSVTPEMQQCATTTAQALYSTDGTDLSDKFKAIAKQVAMLRISK